MLNRVVWRMDDLERVSRRQTISPIVRSVSTSRVLFGWKPKSRCCERIGPRTATIDEVTSTAQIAICTTSSESRTPNRQFRSPKPSRRVLAEWNFASGAIR